MTHEQFKRIWIPLNPSFYKVAFHFLESEDEAKDAVQDLYIKLWNSKGFARPHTESSGIWADTFKEHLHRQAEAAAESQK